MTTPEQYDYQARLARARAARLRALADTIHSTSAPLATAMDDLTRRHTEVVWASASAHRSRTAVRSDNLRVDQAKHLCDLMAKRLRSHAGDEDYIAYRARLHADAARRRAEREAGE